MAALTTTDVKKFLRVDFSDDDTLIASLMAAADEYIKAAVGEGYDNTSERAKFLSLAVISDMYDNRGISDKVSGNMRRLIQDFSQQLRLELIV